MAAAGQVGTGFSKPYVALYEATTQTGVTTVSYSSGQVLARGVEVSVEAETSDDNNFYADNQVAESAAGMFSGGTVTLTVDGLFASAEKLIMGLPSAGDDGFMAYGDSQQIPYVGIGFIRRTMTDGATKYIPYVIPKAMFNQITVSASTQEEDIDWQTQELTAAIHRDDTDNHNWKFVGSAYTTEAAAEAVIKTKLDIS